MGKYINISQEEEVSQIAGPGTMVVLKFLARFGSRDSVKLFLSCVEQHTFARQMFSEHAIKIIDPLHNDCLSTNSNPAVVLRRISLQPGQSLSHIDQRPLHSLRWAITIEWLIQLGTGHPSRIFSCLSTAQVNATVCNNLENQIPHRCI